MKLNLYQLMLAVAIVGGVAWLTVPDMVIVADGRFDLTLHFPNCEPVRSVVVAYCWSVTEAKHAQECGPTTNEIPFRATEIGSNGTHHIDLPHSSKHASDREISYNEPTHIVVQFTCADVVHRKMIAVPSGRGDRMVVVELE